MNFGAGNEQGSSGILRRQPGPNMQSVTSSDDSQNNSRIPIRQQYKTFQLLGKHIGHFAHAKDTENLENQNPYSEEQEQIDEVNMTRATERYQTALKRNEVLTQYKETVKLLGEAQKMHRRQYSQGTQVLSQVVCPVLENVSRVQNQKKMKQLFDNMKLRKENAIEDLDGYHDDIESQFAKSTGIPNATIPIQDSGFDSVVRSNSLESEGSDVQTEDVFNTAYMDLSPQNRSVNELETTVMRRSLKTMEIGVQVGPDTCSKSIQVDTRSFPPHDETDFEVLEPIQRSAKTTQEMKTLFHSTPTLSDSDAKSRNYTNLITSSGAVCDPDPISTDFRQHYSVNSPIFSDLYEPHGNNHGQNYIEHSLTSQWQQHNGRNDRVPFYPPLSDVVPSPTPLSPYLRKLASEYISNENISKRTPERAVPLSKPVRERPSEERFYREDTISSPIPGSFTYSPVGSLTAANIVRNVHKDFQARQSVEKVIKAVKFTDGMDNNNVSSVRDTSSEAASNPFRSRLGELSTTSLLVNVSDPNISGSSDSQSEKDLSPEKFFELKRKKLKIFEQVVKRHLPMHSDTSAEEIERLNPNEHLYHDLSTIREIDSELNNAEDDTPTHVVPVDESTKPLQKMSYTSTVSHKYSEPACQNSSVRDIKPKEDKQGMPSNQNHSSSSSTHEFQVSPYQYNSLASSDQSNRSRRKSDHIVSRLSYNILVNAANDMSKSLTNDPSFCLLSPFSELSPSDSSSNVKSECASSSQENSSSKVSQQRMADAEADVAAVSEKMNVVSTSSSGNDFYPLTKYASSGSFTTSQSANYSRNLLTKSVQKTNYSPYALNLAESNELLSAHSNINLPSAISFRDESVNSSAFQPLTFISDQETYSSDGKTHSISKFQPIVDVSSGSSSSSSDNQLTTRMAIKQSDHKLPSSDVHSHAAKCSSEDVIFKVPLSNSALRLVRPGANHKEQLYPDNIPQVSLTTSSSHCNTNSATSSSDNGERESVSRLKITRSMKYFNQRFGKKTQEAEKRIPSTSSSDEHLSQIFTKPELFCQSTPMKINDDILGITDEPSLTLIGPEFSLSLQGYAASNDLTITDKASRNKNTSTAEPPSCEFLASEENASEAGLSQSLMSFLDHERNAVQSDDNDESFMYLTNEPSSTDETKSANSNEPSGKSK